MLGWLQAPMLGVAPRQNALGSTSACDAALDRCDLRPTAVTSWHGLGTGPHDLEVEVTLGLWLSQARLCIDWRASGSTAERLTYLAPGTTAVSIAPDRLELQLGQLEPSTGVILLRVRASGLKPGDELHFRCDSGLPSPPSPPRKRWPPRPPPGS